MAVPRVFVSSTCYDLKYIRENLKYFINNLGYESILSEEGDVFYNPNQHTHNACISEIQTCQIFVLIIGGRYGGKYLQEEKSITNKEYEEAVNQKIPVFTLIEKNVWNEHLVYQKNKNNANSDGIIYPSVDDIKIFSFIDEVRKNNINNAIYPFGDFHDIESYLKKQWAGMVYNFLANSIETKKVSELFEEIHNATEKIEYYTKQVALNVGDEYTNILIRCYDIMLGSELVQNLKGFWGIEVSPQKILGEEGIDELCFNKIEIYESEGDSITWGGPPYRCSQIRYESFKEQFKELKDELLKVLEERNFSVENFRKRKNK
jgi:hypothetical protein